MADKHPLDDDLGDLWYRRESLDISGWEHLYRIVQEALLSYRPQELSGLPGEREEYVQDFFTSVVMRTSSEPKRYHVGSLRFIYRNFLRDRLDEQKRDRKVFVEMGHDDDNDENIIENFSTESVNECPNDCDFAELIEAGFTVDEVAVSARSWLTNAEGWVAIYLSFHFCPDATHSEPLQKLANRLNISAYHYKATKLGLNWGKGKAGNDSLPFSDTMIGKWLTHNLKIAVSPENQAIIHAAFKILCFEALTRSEERELAK